MAKGTDIQWCDDSVNPTMGCDGCELWNRKRRVCYAGLLHDLRGGNPGYAPTFAQVTTFPGRMAKAACWSGRRGSLRHEKPWLNGSPRLIFVSDMGDSLSKSVTFEYLHSEVIANVMTKDARRHRWLWLTKQPWRMAEFSAWLGELGVPWPDNLWVGTSITSRAAVTTLRIKSLLKVGDKSTTRFLSVEPQVERISIRRWLHGDLHWVIQGGESGVKLPKTSSRIALPVIQPIKRQFARTFEVTWARSLAKECRDAGVCYFLKQLGSNVVNNGEPMRLRDSHGGDWDEWPRDLAVREVPGVANKWSRRRP